MIITAHRQTGEHARLQAGSQEPVVAGLGAGARRSAVGEYALPLAIVAAVTVVGWWLWRRLHRSPRWALQRSVKKARRVNEQVRPEHIPHPVPEMEAAQHDGIGRVDNPFKSTSDSARTADERTRRSGVEQPEEAPVLGPRAQDALDRLDRLTEHFDPKDPRTDYRRLDAFVRRYLFEFYGVKAFGLSSAGVLESLSEALADGVVDTVGEILRVCELAELPRHRASRSELRHLRDLASEMIVTDARAESRR